MCFGFFKNMGRESGLPGGSIIYQGNPYIFQRRTPMLPWVSEDKDGAWVLPTKLGVSCAFARPPRARRRSWQGPRLDAFSWGEARLAGPVLCEDFGVAPSESHFQPVHPRGAKGPHAAVFLLSCTWTILCQCLCSSHCFLFFFLHSRGSGVGFGCGTMGACMGLF